MRYRVLIVDDSAIIRSVVQKSIAMTGMDVSQVFTAANGKEALEVLRREWVDIVFADVNMPVMNGVELVERMSEDDVLSSVPVVMVSSDRSEVRMEELRRKGVQAYIHKPFRPEHFRAVMSDIFVPEDGKSPGTELDVALVRATLNDTLEKAAFVLLDAPSRPDPWRGVVVCGEVSFRGPKKGSVVFATSPGFAMELAANLLGIEVDDLSASRHAHEAVGELLNIFAGQLVGRWFGTAVGCTLGIPRLATVSARNREQRRSQAHVSFTALAEREYRVDADVHIDEE